MAINGPNKLKFARLTKYFILSKTIIASDTQCYTYRYHRDIAFNYAFRKVTYYVTFNLSSFPNEFEFEFGLHDAKTDLGSVRNIEFYRNQYTKGVGQGFMFKYEHYQLNYLESPFITNCFDYDHGDCTSPRNCYEECVNNYTVAKFGTCFSEAQLDNRGKNCNVHHRNQTMSIYKQTLNRFKLICRSRYTKKSCTENFYPGVSKPIANIRKGRFFKFEVGPRYKPSTYVDYQPIITLVDFGVFILSTISFWLGFAPYTSIIDTRHYVETKCSDRIHEQGLPSARNYRSNQLRHQINHLTNDNRVTQQLLVKLEAQ